MIMRHRLHGSRLPVREQEIERRVRRHIAIRDADPAETERLKVQQEAEDAARLAEFAQGVRKTFGRQPYVLSTGNGGSSATLTALADKARALMVQNDPDAVRAGLAQIADALDTCDLEGWIEADIPKRDARAGHQ
jgi:hypothetical protein